MIRLTPNLLIADDEVQLTAVRAQGAGGQNVNKVSSAIHLRFDIATSSLPDRIKTRLLAQSGHHLTQDGVIVIKAQVHRSQDMNRKEAMSRLAELLKKAAWRPKARHATKPTRSSQRKRVDAKKRKGEIKSTRGKPVLE